MDLNRYINLKTTIKAAFFESKPHGPNESASLINPPS